MKKLQILLLVCFMMVGHLATAQIVQGQLLIGGTAGFNTTFVEDQDNPFTIQILPSIYKLITPNIAIGGEFGIQYDKVGDRNTTSVAVLPGARYYFTDGASGPAFFVSLGVGVATARSEFNGTSDSATAFAYTVGPGVAFFVSKNISIDAILAYQRIGGDVDTSGIGLNIGVQAYLGGGE